MRLYHFSDEPGIARFEPRPSASRPQGQACVWAIDEAHSPLYFFPRDCPTVVYWPTELTSDADRATFWTGVAACMVAAIEWNWFDALSTRALYGYELPHGSFEPLHDYGAHLSRVAVVPIRVDELRNLPAHWAGAAVELRLSPRLLPLHLAISASTMEFHSIRLRNAHQ